MLVAFVSFGTMRGHQLVSQKQWTDAMSEVKLARAEPRVWIDIGTSWRSLASWDLDNNASLVVVGADALKSNLDDPRQSTSPRFVRVEGACGSSGDATTTFFKHASPTCGSLLPTRREGPVLGTGADACTGDDPERVTVRQFTLHSLINRLIHLGVLRIQLLKIDIQGSELPCLRSASNVLGRVDNILLEVQDVFNSSPLQMYEGAASLVDIDPFLEACGFRRQYCEWNKWGKRLREMNCLFSNTRSPEPQSWLWATGNSRRARSVVSYLRERPRHLDVAFSLLTSNNSGTRVAV